MRILFSGGPFSGKLLEVPDDTNEWVVPILPEPKSDIFGHEFANIDPGRPMSTEKIIYRRTVHKVGEVDGIYAVIFAIDGEYCEDRGVN